MVESVFVLSMSNHKSVPMAHTMGNTQMQIITWVRQETTQSNSINQINTTSKEMYEIHLV